MKIRSKMIMLSVIPLLITVIVICAISSANIDKSMREVIERDLMALTLNQKESLSQKSGNDYRLDDDGNMWNATTMNITNNVTMADQIAQESGIHTVVYYEDTSRMTTIKDADGNRLGAIQATDDVVAAVLEGRENYFSASYVINGEEYFAYFVPINNTGIKKPVGMVSMCMKRADIESSINDIIKMIILVAVVGLVVCACLILVVATLMANRIKRGVNVLGQVAEGDLTGNINKKDAKAKDEIGDIIRAVGELKDKLVSVVANIFEKSGEVYECSNTLSDATAETTIAVEQVENAVCEMAEGATSQAEDTQQATESVLEMGELIEKTSGNVDELYDNANRMEEKGIVATQILKELDQVNAKAKDSIDVIYDQTSVTNASVKKISKAVGLISSIAEETNLLSLNASIEAARAGEQGKGFAVVAKQIQKLAEQSNESANQIENIVLSLIENSQKEVEIMEEVKVIMAQQSEMVDKTGQIVNDVIDSVSKSREEVKIIADNTRELDDARAVVVDLVQNLSAIAQENAASTEETSASATEVNATIQEMSGNAQHLRMIAEKLEESIRAFKIAEADVNKTEEEVLTENPDENVGAESYDQVTDEDYDIESGSLTDEGYDTESGSLVDEDTSEEYIDDVREESIYELAGEDEVESDTESVLDGVEFYTLNDENQIEYENSDEISYDDQVEEADDESENSDRV